MSHESKQIKMAIRQQKQWQAIRFEGGERKFIFSNIYIGIHVTEKSEQDPSIPKYLLSILCGARFGIITSVSQVFYSQIKKLSTIES